MLYHYEIAVQLPNFAVVFVYIFVMGSVYHVVRGFWLLRISISCVFLFKIWLDRLVYLR